MTGFRTSTMPGTAERRPGISASEIPKSPVRSPTAKVDISASDLIQQLSDVSRRLKSPNLEPVVVAILETKRTALVGELRQAFNVDVISRPDGTYRVRNNEGRVLLDSKTPQQELEGPDLGSADSSSSLTLQPEQAITQYAKVAEPGEVAAPRSTLSMNLESQADREVHLNIPSIETVQSRMDVLNQLNASLEASTSTLQAANTRMETLQSLLG